VVVPPPAAHDDISSRATARRADAGVETAEPDGGPAPAPEGRRSARRQRAERASGREGGAAGSKRREGGGSFRDRRSRREPQGSSKAKTIAIIILAVMGIGAGAFFMLTGKEKPKRPPSRRGRRRTSVPVPAEGGRDAGLSSSVEAVVEHRPA
jgi:hypothetical protein